MLDAQERIAALEVHLAAKTARIAEQTARIAHFEQRVAELIEQIAVLTERLGQNSRNSHKPPSSDTRGSGAAKGTGKGKRSKKTGRKRGGQRGHKGRHRELLPASQVDHFIDHFPEQCQSCWKQLPETVDACATRTQVTEVPPIVPETTEHRCHAVTCNCGYTTRADHASLVPTSPFGPRLMSLVGLLTGVYHLSRRKTVTLLSDVLGVQISLGAVSAVEDRVSAAVKPAVDEAWEKVGDAPVKHTDGTSWFQAGVSLSLWTIATTMVTVFKIVTDGSKKTLRPLYGALKGILVSDRDSSLTFWAMERRQICWAHLLRKFISFSERDGPAGDIGRELLDYTGLIFEYWHQYKAGTLSKATFRAWMAPVRAEFEALLARAVAADIPRLSGSCANLLEHQQALWTFIDCDGVQPTNNHAERELRAFVLWRRRSFGTQSERGNLFAERLMTVAHTARKQNVNVFSFLTACCRAYLGHAAMPSLFAPNDAAAA